MSDLTTIGGYIRMSPQLIAEANDWQSLIAEQIRLDSIGPWHGPPLPAALALRRRLNGRPAGKYQRERTPI